MSNGTSIALQDLPQRVWARAITALRAEEATRSSIQEVPWRQRAMTALAIGLASGLLAYYSVQRPGAVPDFLYPWTGIRLFLDGTNPYVAMRANGAPPYDEALFYPFTAPLALLPIARLSLATAASVFFGLSSAALAYVITRDGLWRVHVFMSAPFVTAALLVQFSPLLMAATFLPAVGFLTTLKPNIGLPLLLYRPTWKAVVGSAVFVAITLAVFPRWPLGWLDSIRHDAQVGSHAIPMLQLGGVLLALAVLRWRRPAGRLLLAMSIIPAAALLLRSAAALAHPADATTIHRAHGMQPTRVHPVLPHAHAGSARRPVGISVRDRAHLSTGPRDPASSAKT